MSHNKIFVKHCPQTKRHTFKIETSTTWKLSVFRVFLVFIFPHLDWIRRDTEFLSILSPKAGKYEPENLRIGTLFTWWLNYGNKCWLNDGNRCCWKQSNFAKTFFRKNVSSRSGLTELTLKKHIWILYAISSCEVMHKKWTGFRI